MILYWLYSDDCKNPETDGYIGITNDVKRRSYEHKKITRFPKEYQVKVLFEGTKEDCQSLERELRPIAAIGWNIVPGGGIPPSQIGKKRSPETLEKLKRPLTEEIKKKIGQANKDKPKTLTSEQRLFRRDQMKYARSFKAR